MGEMVEMKGWIKIDKNGDYDENGKKILVRDFKDEGKLNIIKMKIKSLRERLIL